MKKIILSGGGTLGSVTPLIAIKQELEADGQYEFLFVGTQNGVEKNFVQQEYGMNYRAISSGKFRRYLSLQNLIDPFKILKGIFDGFKIINEFQPDVIVTAGAFVSVPLIYAAWLKKIPVVVHQLDIQIGLANKIMSQFANKVTVTFEKNKKDFPSGKVELVGNPIRQELFQGDKQRAKEFFKIQNDLPTLLVLGGSTGAQKVNELIEQSYKKLLDVCNIILVTGQGKKNGLDDGQSSKGVLRVYENLTKALPDAFAAADLVVTRAGLVTITELIAVQKPMIVIPIANNQQEENADFLAAKQAATILREQTLDDSKFIQTVIGLFANPAKLKNMADNATTILPKNSATKLAQIIKDAAK